MLLLHDIFVFLTGGARRGPYNMKGEVWVQGQKQDEALTHGAVQLRLLLWC